MSTSGPACGAPDRGKGLVEVGLLVTQPGDQVGDFDGVYDFADAFGDVYEWSGVRGA